MCIRDSIGTFQFESPGMQKYLRELKPTVFEDLIAMNADVYKRQLNSIIAQKDSEINDMMGTLNEIQDGLNQIRCV